MTRWLAGAIILGLLGSPIPAAAQGGVASGTGAMQGRVLDTQGGALPGVAVTASSTSLLVAQTSITSETGNYRFPSVPPGTYTLTFELTGFGTVRRENIVIALGFTGTINVEMGVATLEETVLVAGGSPLIDTSATRVQQNFKLEQLQSIPNGRDMWSLLAITPGVQMGRIDVAGNRVGTQTPYTVYGINGQVRVLIEGINTTEAQGFAGFYFDYGSFEESFIGTSAQTAEMPHPGVQSSFIGRSGGNQFAGEYYLDWYNNSLQGSNIPDEYTAPTAFNNSPIQPHSNEVEGYYDTNVNVGGPVKRDKLWWHFSYRDQKNRVRLPNYLFPETHNTRLWNPTTKWTYQLNPNHKLIGYYQYGHKVQPRRPPSSDFYNDPGPTYEHQSGTWVYKAEWNASLGNNLFVEARYGNFGSFIIFTPNTDADYFWRDSALRILEGAQQHWERPLDRKQFNGALNYFIDSSKGSHTLKFGFERSLDSKDEGFLQRYGGDIEHIYANGRPSTVAFFLPTAKGISKFGNKDYFTSQAKVNADGFFATDSWAIGNVTLNLGMRWDRYRSFTPEQEQLAGTSGPVTIQAATFPETTFATWNTAFAPRIGVVWDPRGGATTVIKASYGLFWHNPSYVLADTANTNQAQKSQTYAWSDANGDRRWQPGEQGAVLATALAGTISVDPDIKQAYTHEFGTFLEQRITESIGSRVGFVYKTEDDLWAAYRPGRGIDAYTVPFNFLDVGPDGFSGTSDDQTRSLLGLPSAQQAAFPVNQVIMNTGAYGRYKTIEASMTKRYSNKWSAVLGGSHTWSRNFPRGFPNDPNAPSVEDTNYWDIKLSGSYDAPWGLQLSPVLRHQAGLNFARQVVVPASAATAAGLIYNGTIFAESADSRRQDNIWVFDVRTQKSFDISSTLKLRFFLDLFNLTNSHASETITETTGLSFLKPANILAPRTARVGFRFMW